MFRRPTGWQAFWSLGGATLIVLVTTYMVPARASSKEAMSSLRFGWPFHWVTQNQGWMDPPRFPRYSGLQGPWENPTTVTWWALAADVLLVAMLLWVIGRMVAWQMRPATPTEESTPV